MTNSAITKQIAMVTRKPKTIHCCLSCFFFFIAIAALLLAAPPRVVIGFVDATLVVEDGAIVGGAGTGGRMSCETAFPELD
jgi:hypothetical protein